MTPHTLLLYHRWANSQLATQIEALPQEVFERNIGGSFGSLRATLIHMLEADSLWLERFRSRAVADLPGWSPTTAKLINQKWMRVQEDLVAVAKDMSQHPEKLIEFTTRKGQPFAIPFEEIVTHISHHGSYHRGQLANMVRIAGHQPVGTDYFIFSTQKK